MEGSELFVSVKSLFICNGSAGSEPPLRRLIRERGKGRFLRRVAALECVTIVVFICFK